LFESTAMSLTEAPERGVASADIALHDDPDQVVFWT
jgi:hypothetical protein